MLIKNLIAILITALCSSTAAAQLTSEQKVAKERGITLYNQHKAISAEPYLKIAAEAGDRESQYFLGEALRFNNRYMTSEAQKWYMAAAEQGDMYAMRRLASAKSDLCTVMGNCSESAKTTLDWLNMMVVTAEPLIEQGDGEAMYMMYRATGDFEWLEKSAEAGYPYGQYWLAIQYRQGEGFFFPPWTRAERIEDLMKKSSDGGYVNGMGEYMGILQEKGDLAAARALLIKIAETGDALAIGSYGAYLSHTPNTLDYRLDLGGRKN